MQIKIFRTRHPPQIFHRQLAELQKEAGFPATDDDIRRRLKPLPREDRLLMALDGEELIGYAHLRVTRDLMNEETAEVVAIVVRRDSRRKGVGRRLIAAAETWAKQSGRARLLLRTEVVRTGAHAFFVALGYEEGSTAIEFIRDLE